MHPAVMVVSMDVAAATTPAMTIAAAAAATIAVVTVATVVVVEDTDNVKIPVAAGVAINSTTTRAQEAAVPKCALLDRAITEEAIQAQISLMPDSSGLWLVTY
jgi:hypothetical protein